MRSTLILGILSIICMSANASFNLPVHAPSCDSLIYCYGELLNTVQMAKLNVDSKTFVDMKLKQHPNITLENFQIWKQDNGDNPSREAVQKFVDDNFDETSKEFEYYWPSDWKENPEFIEYIADSDFKQWGINLHYLWPNLGRKMTDDVHEHPELYSIIPVRNPVIVPGGRFREFYYWDSYWIIRGLLHSEMFDTAKGMLENFLTIVERFGFIPNGGRIYYKSRSQPPLIAPMVKSYVDATGDEEFMLRATPVLEREFEFWMNNHMIEVQGHSMATYGDFSRGPRPESYVEDMITAQAFSTDEDIQEHFSELKAAAASGMDFSSRWFIKNGTNNGTLIDMKVSSIVPVELNAILFWNAKIISEFLIKSGQLSRAAEYEVKSQEIFDAVQSVLWHDDIGAWLDYDLINNKRRNYFVPTNLSPLWTMCFNTADSQNITEKVLKYIDNMGIDNYPGGVPNTLEQTGEQWDFPNVWPPMQYLLIIGLDNLQNEQSSELAYRWAERWVQSNYYAYKKSNNMYEKYSATVFGDGGRGGEYEVQLGFGWSNGVIVELLVRYGDRLKPWIEV